MDFVITKTTVCESTMYVNLQQMLSHLIYTYVHTYMFLVTIKGTSHYTVHANKLIV